MNPLIAQYGLLAALLFLGALCCGRKESWDSAAIVLLLIWSIIESVIAILQVAGYAGVRNHDYFILLGSFSNPGLLGGFLSVTMSAAVAYLVNGNKNKFIYILAWVALAFGAVVIPATRSRTAWLAFAVALLWCVFRNFRIRELVKTNIIYSIAVAAIVGIITVCGFLMKKDSAIGRFHMWRIESMVIWHNPIKGVRADGFLCAYAEEQESFFRKQQRSDIITRVAGCPRYAYNEYLKYGMAYGVVGLLISIALTAAVIRSLLKCHSIIAYPAIAFAIFAMASFPMSIVQFRIVLTIIISSWLFQITFKHKSWIGIIVSSVALLHCIIICPSLYSEERERREAIAKWKSASPLLGAGEYAQAIAILEPLYCTLNNNSTYLFDYGYALHCLKDYEHSNMALYKGSKLSSDPMFFDIIAKNHMSLGNYSEAERCLHKAHYMVPCRVYPLVLLMKFYIQLGHYEKAEMIGKQISEMNINVKNTNMVTLKDEADSLVTYIQYIRNEKK